MLATGLTLGVIPGSESLDAVDITHHGSAAAAIGLLFMNGTMGYLGFAGTDPEHRARDAQLALVRSRILGIKEYGAQWRIAETNTAISTSLRNLLRAGLRLGCTAGRPAALSVDDGKEHDPDRARLNESSNSHAPTPAAVRAARQAPSPATATR